MIFQRPRIKFRFGLRGLLVGITLLAIPLAAAGNRWRHAVPQEKFVCDVLATHGWVKYDDGWNPREVRATAISDEGCVTIFEIDMISADALRERNFWHDVVTVGMGRVQLGEESPFQEVLAAIPDYPAIRQVALSGPGVTPDVITRLAVLKRLSDLRLDDVPIDDALVDSIRRLPALKSLVVSCQRSESLDSHAVQMAEIASQLRASLPRVSVTIDDAVNAPP